MKTILMLLLLTPLAAAQTTQTWFKACPEGSTVSATKGETLRFGNLDSTYAITTGSHKQGDPAPAAWSVPKTLTEATTISDLTSFFGGDPDYGVVKEVDILEIGQQQSINCIPAGSNNGYMVLVPAAPMATVSDSAMIISQTGSVSLTQDETAALKAAIAAVQQAKDALAALQKQISAAHNVSPNGPYQLVTDFSVTIDQPPTQ